MLTVDSVKRKIEGTLYYLGTCGSCSSETERRKSLTLELKALTELLKVLKEEQNEN